MGIVIGGGLGDVLANRLKKPTVTRHALMVFTSASLGREVVLFTGLNVIRVFSLMWSEVGLRREI